VGPALLAAIRIRPDYIEAHHNLGSVLTELHRPKEAVVWLKQAVRLCQNRQSPAVGEHTDQNSKSPSPNERTAAQAYAMHSLLPSALNQLGLAFAATRAYRKAERCYHRALDLKPTMADVHSNLGNLYQEEGRLPEALASYELALMHDSQSASTHWNRSLSILQHGDFERGWREYEWRWQRKQTPARPFRQPRWDGRPFRDRTLLIYMEQGLGDMLQFIRFAAQAKERGGRVLVECPGFLAPLLSRCRGIDELVIEGSILPDFDLQIPIMSLPAALGTTLATVTRQVPYLFVEEDRCTRWREWLAKIASAADPTTERFNVGIAWQGNPNHRLDRYRSIALCEFGLLAKIPGARLISLQKGPGALQIQQVATGFPVHEPPQSEQMTAEALLDTAALMRCLDLVISVDTGTAHLAGGLGVPVWVPLSAIGEWRWLLHRETRPWYPTMRLFRQKKLGRWKLVFRRMAAELRNRVESGSSADRSPATGMA